MIEAGALYKTLHEASDTAVFRTDAAGRVVEINRRWSPLTGLDWKETFGLFWPDCALDEDRPRVRDEWDRSLAEGSPFVGKFRTRTNSGESVWVLARVTPVLGSGGLAAGHIGLLTDMSPVVALEDERARLQSAIDQISEIVLITDTTGSLLYANPAFYRVTGYSFEESAGKNLRFLNGGRHGRAFFAGLWKTITEGRVWKGTIRNRKKDGSDYEAETSISPVRDSGGEIRYFVGVQRDVTGEAELRARLGAAQRLEAVGRLAGGVTHDFNNLLTVFSGAASFIEGRLPAGHAALGDVGDIRETVERASRLTRQLLLFSRRRPGERRAIEVDALAREMEKFLGRVIGEDIELRIEAGAPGARVWIDPSQLEQVILNLAVNARDAMPAGGTLAIATARLDAGGAAPEPGLEAGPYLSLRVSDTGCGMTPATLDRIYEPFFTTKPDKGTGLGLSTVYGIVAACGGRITVESVPGRGTAFLVLLPETDRRAEGPVRPKPPPARGEGGPVTVLVAEDDPAVRKILVKTAKLAGFTVLEAPDGLAAVEAARDRAGSIDLLIADVVMPRMGGPECAREIARARPGLKVLLISGHSDERYEPGGIPGLQIETVQKPFTPAELLEAAARLGYPANTSTSRSAE